MFQPEVFVPAVMLHRGEVSSLIVSVNMKQRSKNLWLSALGALALVAPQASAGTFSADFNTSTVPDGTFLNSTPPPNETTPLGSGIIEFMAIGTAVKRMQGIQTLSQQLPPQAIIRDKDTFVNVAETALGTSLNDPRAWKKA